MQAKPGEVAASGQGRTAPSTTLEEVVINELIPMVDCQLPYLNRQEKPRNGRAFDGRRNYHAHNH